MNDRAARLFSTHLSPKTEHPTPSQYLLYAVLVFACVAVGGRLSLFLHEAVGHALFAHLLGADIISIEVRPFGGGRARYRYPADVLHGYRFLSTSGGIAVDLLSCAFAIGLAGLCRRLPIAVLFLSLWACRSLIGAMGYLVMGLYYRSGDPGRVLYLMGFVDPPWLSIGPWLAALLLTPFAGFVIARLYIQAQEHWLPTQDLWRRVARCACAVGLAFALLNVGRVVLNPAPTVAFEADAKRNAAAHAHKTWLLEQTRLYRADHPDAAPEAVQAHIKQLLAQDSEPKPSVPEPLPMRFLFVIAVALGCLIPMVRPPPPHLEGNTLTLVHALAALTIAVVLLTLLAWEPLWLF